MGGLRANVNKGDIRCARKNENVIGLAKRVCHRNCGSVEKRMASGCFLTEAQGITNLLQIY